MSFHRIITAEAKKQGLSGYRLAQISGIPMRTVQKYLARDSDLAGESVAKLAAALGLELRRARRRKEG